MIVGHLNTSTEGNCILGFPATVWWWKALQFIITSSSGSERCPIQEEVKLTRILQSIVKSAMYWNSSSDTNIVPEITCFCYYRCFTTNACPGMEDALLKKREQDMKLACQKKNMLSKY